MYIQQYSRPKYFCRKPVTDDVNWPLYTKDQPQYFIFNAEKNGIGRGPRATGCAFWNNFFPRLRDNPGEFSTVFSGFAFKETAWKRRCAASKLDISIEVWRFAFFIRMFAYREYKSIIGYFVISWFNIRCMFKNSKSYDIEESYNVTNFSGI